MKTKCPACSNEMIETQLSRHHESYLYCRVCKKELKEITALETSPTGYWTGGLTDFLFPVPGKTYAQAAPHIPHPNAGPSAFVLPAHSLKPCGFDPIYGNDVHWLDASQVPAPLTCTCGCYDAKGTQLAVPHPTVPGAQQMSPSYGIASIPPWSMGCVGNNHFFLGNIGSCRCGKSGNTSKAYSP